MKPISQYQRNKQIIELSLNILIDGKPQLTQKEIVEHLQKLNIKISTSSINKARKRIGELRQPTAKLLSECLPQLVENLTSFRLNIEKIDFISKKNLASPSLKMFNENSSRAIKIYPKGRISLEQKVKFISEAEQEVIEIGLSLRTLTTYFTSRNRFEYQHHIEKLLERGVNFKFLLFNPDTELAQQYFENRNEQKRTQIIKDVIVDLKNIQQQYNTKKFKGQFQLMKYSHFPYLHILMIDTETENAKILVSHYLHHHVKRADTPVFSFTKKGNPILFETYKHSFQATLDEAVVL